MTRRKVSPGFAPMGPCTKSMFPYSFTTRKTRRPAITSTTISIWPDGSIPAEVAPAAPKCASNFSRSRSGNMIENNEQLFASIQKLIESWCDRRSLRALRNILRGYPLVSPLGDGWGELLIALQDVRAFAKDELTAEEFKVLEDCIRAVDTALNRAAI